MRSLKSLWLIGKTFLVWESAVAGFIFLAIALVALFDPALTRTVESFDCYTKAKIIAQYWLPGWETDAIIIATSFFFGASNMAIVLASIVRTRR